MISAVNEVFVEDVRKFMSVYFCKEITKDGSLRYVWHYSELLCIYSSSYDIGVLSYLRKYQGIDGASKLYRGYCSYRLGIDFDYYLYIKEFYDYI